MRHSNYFYANVGRALQGKERKSNKKPTIKTARAIDPELIEQVRLSEPEYITSNPKYNSLLVMDTPEQALNYYNYDYSQVNHPNMLPTSNRIDNDGVMQHINANYETALANTLAVKANASRETDLDAIMAVKANSKPVDGFYEMLRGIPAETRKAPQPTSKNKNIKRIYEYYPTSRKMRKVYGDNRYIPDYVPMSREIYLSDTPISDLFK